MKAFHIMMFLLLFNMTLTAIGVINIYPLITKGAETIATDTGSTSINVTKGQDVLKEYFISMTITTFLTGIVVGTALSIFTRLPAATSIAFGSFAGLFWSSTMSTFAVLWSLFPKGTGGDMGFTVVIAIFGIVVFFIFMAGFIQMVSGGWRTYE